MLQLISPSGVYENIAVLSKTLNRNLEINSYMDMELAFHRFLENYQPEVPRIQTTGTHIIKDVAIGNKLAELFSIESVLDDKHQYMVVGQPFNTEEFILAEKHFNDTMDFIKEICPEAHFAFNLIIDSIFLRKSEQSGGGSTSNAIGVIWLNSRNYWSKNDLAELLIHELTHNMMFIDEARYLHYSDYDLILDPKNFTQSAILHTRRPLDKVVHSIVVATELLLFRKNLIGEPSNPLIHPPSEMIRKQTLDACQSLMSMPNYNELTTDRCKFLLNSCMSHIGN